MSRADLQLLAARYAGDPAFRAALDGAATLEEGVAVAAAAGMEVTVEDLMRVLRADTGELSDEALGMIDGGGARSTWWRQP